MTRSVGRYFDSVGQLWDEERLVTPRLELEAD